MSLSPDFSKKPSQLSTISWILYDLANTAYSMNIVSLYFGTWIIIDLARSDAWVSLVNALSMLLVAFTMPVLGDWSDIKNKKIPALLLFTAVCISGTTIMGLLGNTVSNIDLLLPLILILYVLTNYSYQGGLVFYNALMPSVSTPKTIGRVSGYGVGIGYMGTIIGLVVARLFVEGNAFGLTIPGISGGGTSAAFVPTAVLFFIFALPIFIFVHEKPPSYTQDQPWKLSHSYRKVFHNIRDTKKYPGLLRFLIAKLLYEDSVQTIVIYMGVYTQIVMGFSREQANLFLIVLTPFAILGSAFCGILTDHYGPKKTLTTVIFLWIVSLFMIVLISNHIAFWILGGIIGVLLGSTWTSARPLLITLAPNDMLGEFFGLYALSGKLAAIIGPLIWSTVTLSLSAFGNVFKFKAAILALAVIMIIGLLVLKPVPDFHPKLKKGEIAN
ncbi:MFS transporter [candidate division KSB1 bacterium]|nr:MFS transporter [candidate division KSB1 bacterium]